MSSFAIDGFAVDGCKPSSNASMAAAAHTDRIGRLKEAVQKAKPGICAERALIWTAYFKDRCNRGKPRAIQAAEALREVLLRKTVRIHPDELVVGNFVSRRVGGAIYPELHGVAMLREIATFPTREVNPLEATPEEIAALEADRAELKRQAEQFAKRERYAALKDEITTAIAAGETPVGTKVQEFRRLRQELGL